jgi:hypothetical protein
MLLKLTRVRNKDIKFRRESRSVKAKNKNKKTDYKLILLGIYEDLTSIILLSSTMNLGSHITDILGNTPNLKGMDC